MIKVNDLRICENELIIDVEINSSLCSTANSNQCNITQIKIYNQDSYGSETPSCVISNIDSDSYSDTITLNGDVIKLKSSDLMFIDIYWDGNPISDCPCGEDENPDKFVVYDKHYIYRLGMNYLSELTNCCSANINATDFILTQKYFELCLKNGDIMDAITLWNSMTSNISSMNTSNCGCNG